MGILDERAEILDRRLRALAREAVRMVHIPERAYGVAPYRGEDGGETVGVGINAVRLDQERHSRRLCDRSKLLHGCDDVFVVEIGRNVGGPVAEDSYILASDGGGDRYISFKLRDRLFTPFGIAKGASGRQAAYLEFHPLESFLRFGEVFVAERTRRGGELRPSEPSHLDPAEAEVLRHRPYLVPREVGRAER